MNRAVAARPRLVLFDSPTSGLDPITSKTGDNEVIKPRDLERVTTILHPHPSILVTHQLEDAFYVAAHQAVERNGRVAIVPDEPRAGEAEFVRARAPAPAPAAARA